MAEPNIPAEVDAGAVAGRHIRRGPSIILDQALRKKRPNRGYGGLRGKNGGGR